ncbi:MAG TPA: GNAT family N-acetyltransferase [Patescibacteria group bacterium]|nr:GNAT family N-acetyltransferase [Patescibacteria group bacterium]
MNSIFNTEIEYVKCFSEYDEQQSIIRFWDDRLPDMYGCNYTFIKDKPNQDKLIELISNEITIRKFTNKKFLQIETNFVIEPEVINALPESRVTIMDYMHIETDNYNRIKSREDALVLCATTEDILRDGIAVDLQANIPVMGEFAKRRIARKSEVYRDLNKALDLYVCYDKGLPIGNCELFTLANIAKIEDFDIIEQYQRKGFGSTVLKHLLTHLYNNGIQDAYLVTDASDTAKDMYSKCGFKRISQKYQLFFSLE